MPKWVHGDRTAAHLGRRQGLQGGPNDWIAALRRYLVVGAAAHFAWEVGQLPLYSIWRTGTTGELAAAILHCTAGDVLIAGSSVLTALVLVGRQGWPSESIIRVAGLTIVIGLAYTVYSEWFNTAVRMSWAYTERMPILPVLGTGLAPLAQWIFVPMLALWAAQRKDRESGARSNRGSEA